VFASYTITEDKHIQTHCILSGSLRFASGFGGRVGCRHGGYGLGDESVRPVASDRTPPLVRRGGLDMPPRLMSTDSCKRPDVYFFKGLLDLRSRRPRFVKVYRCDAIDKYQPLNRSQVCHCSMEAHACPSLFYRSACMFNAFPSKHMQTLLN